MNPAPIRLLHFSSLFPNAAQPIHGIFVEQRLRHLLATGQVQARVVAPVPKAPFLPAAIPQQESRHGLAIYHPPFFHLTGLGMVTAPGAMAVAALPLLRQLDRQEPFDLIDAHYFYPDGVAAAWLAARLGKPLVITGRGTDLNLLPRYWLPRHLIKWAAQRADAIVTVAQALQAPLLDLGIGAERMTTLRNGVDLQLFSPTDRQQARRNLGCQRPTLLTVGHLVPRKGCHHVIEAMTLLPDAELMIVGQGPEEASLRRLVARRHLGQRVRFMGVVPPEQIKEYYTAADILVLASSREGWANCLLEAMACGTPVAVTAVWGAPEIIQSPQAGALIPEATPQAIAHTCRNLLDHPPLRTLTRRYAEDFSWQATSQGLLTLFRHILQRHSHG